MKFPCIECGLCCRAAGQVRLLRPLLNREGMCRHFDTKTNLCRIYRSRPEICNVSAMYERYFKRVMSEDEFILLNLKVCYMLNERAQDADNMVKLAALIADWDAKCSNGQSMAGMAKE